MVLLTSLDISQRWCRLLLPSEIARYRAVQTETGCLLSQAYTVSINLFSLIPLQRVADSDAYTRSCLRGRRKLTRYIVIPIYGC